MPQGVLLQQLLISLLLGLLVGLQRERAESDIAGFRTFPLISTLGTLCAALSEHFGYGWIVGAGFAGVISLMIVGNLPKLRQDKPDTGVTTEVAMLVMYAVGAYVVVGPWLVAVAVAGGTAILLHYKPLLHGFATRMGDQDFRAILQFVLISFIVLPVLKEYDHNYDPLRALQPLFPTVQFVTLEVLNPYEIWLMVVLVVSISLSGYVSYKIFGSKAGVVLGGILGGTISSTATTASYSRRTAHRPRMAAMSATAIVIASAIVFVRVLVEISVAAPEFVPEASGPIFILFAASLVLAVVVWLMQDQQSSEMPIQENPTELRSALWFGLLYAAIVVAVALARELFKQDTGLYAVAALSGLTDMDAVTLSTSKLVTDNRLAASTGWRLIVVASMSNLFFKAILVAVLGHRACCVGCRCCSAACWSWALRFCCCGADAASERRSAFSDLRPALPLPSAARCG